MAKLQHTLLRNIICPHCWHTFEPAKTLWVSASTELLGDFRLGEREQQRFLPTRFDARGYAVDRKGVACRAIACPFCHLEIPRSLLEMPPYFISIVGAPASGKSYFLTSMTWRLEKILPRHFLTSFSVPDPQMNYRLHEYESVQFLNEDENQIVKINKTEEQGDLYNTVLIGDQTVTYPQPFLFSLSLLPGHINDANADKFAMSLCLYDNAGESYLPTKAADSSLLPVTRHLAKSNCIFFLFDPIQDTRFRALCRGGSRDPQLNSDFAEAGRRSPMRQEMVLAEMIKRTRTYRQLQTNHRLHVPVVVVVTKLDAWQHLLPESNLKEPWHLAHNSSSSVFLMRSIREVSEVVRKLLMDVTPEVISMVEQFASDVVYVPVSATGGSPQVDAQTGTVGFRSKDINPIWVEVPMLYALARSTQGIIPFIE
ncbi:MAG: hypothetical protein PHQ75_10020 [Thermoguttaceae bacterium]|nr:hypothetical protein [Thermoguttaceae bacterium]